MEKNATKQNLKAEFKTRKKLGGFFVIRNLETGRLLPGVTTDLRRSQNRFEFAQSTGSCVDLKLQKDWGTSGGKAFAFEVLEELAQGESQTDSDFDKDIKLLREMWLEKLSDKDLY